MSHPDSTERLIEEKINEIQALPDPDRVAFHRYRDYPIAQHNRHPQVREE